MVCSPSANSVGIKPVSGSPSSSRPSALVSSVSDTYSVETPAGTKMVLDVHPSVRPMLGDSSVPLWITEGVKKADALVSRGCTAIALLGVWNWRGTNSHGGKVALADWESIALNNRKILICFDSDVMTKSEVYRALIRLSTFLERRA